KTLVSLESARWATPQVLQFHLCWLFLALYMLAVLNAEIDSWPPGERHIAFGIYAASLIAYPVLLHGLLRATCKTCSGMTAKRLLLLRVFGSSDVRERLLDGLEDTWRRVGRVDLIAGTDLAMRTLRSWTLECFLLRRLDTQFLRTDADVDQRLA